MAWSLNPFPTNPDLPVDTRKVFPGDPIAARLPAEAAAKLTTLRTLAAEASAVRCMYSDDYIARREDVMRSEGDLARALTGFRREVWSGTDQEVEGFRALSEEDPAIQQLRERIQHQKGELERASRLRDASGERARLLRGLLKLTITPWVERWPADHRLTGHAPIALSAKMISNLPAALEKCRADRQHHLDKVEAINAAPMPSAEAKRRARIQVASLAKRGAPTVLDLIDLREQQFRWPMSDVRSVPDTTAILAWFNPDALVRRIEEEIDQRSDDANALSDTEKEKRIAEINAIVLDAERIEEAIIVAAEQAGTPLLRRFDADPRAVLGLSNHVPPEA